MIEYRNSAEKLLPGQLHGFFEGWPNPPSPETHLRLLQHSSKIVVAIDTESNNVVGFITAVSDGVLSAYIPFLEVLGSYRNRGIGTELVSRMFKRLSNLYMIDLICDPELAAFYERLGMTQRTGMVIRNFEHQSGRTAP